MQCSSTNWAINTYTCMMFWVNRLTVDDLRFIINIIKQTNFNIYNFYVYQFRLVRRERSFVGERSLSCPVIWRRWQWCCRQVWYIRFVDGLAARSSCSFRSGCKSGTIIGYCWQFSGVSSSNFRSGCTPYPNRDGTSSKMKTRWTGGLFHSARFTYDRGWKISLAATCSLRSIN